MSGRSCRADPPRPDGHVGGPNYGKPHLPVMGKFNERPRRSCLYCGRWLED